MDFLSRVHTRWQDVAPTMSTAVFLATAKDLLHIFDVMGSITLSPMKADMQHNIDVMETKYKESPQTTGTLGNFLAALQKNDTVWLSMLWLWRALEFIAAVFKIFLNSSKDMFSAFQEAYNATLYHHHTFFQRMAAKVALVSVPTRLYLTPRLGNLKEVAVYFDGMDKIVQTMPHPK